MTGSSQINSLSEARNVVVTFAGPASPIDAVKAAITYVEATEGYNAKKPGVDFAGNIVLTGAHAHEVHIYTLALTIATATYAFTFVETVPTIDDIS